jgi:hypothetical protein
MKQLASLAWKEWHDARWFFFAALVGAPKGR